METLTILYAEKDSTVAAQQIEEAEKFFPGIVIIHVQFFKSAKDLLERHAHSRRPDLIVSGFMMQFSPDMDEKGPRQRRAREEYGKDLYDLATKICPKTPFYFRTRIKGSYIYKMLGTGPRKIGQDHIFNKNNHSLADILRIAIEKHDPIKAIAPEEKTRKNPPLKPAP